MNLGCADAVEGILGAALQLVKPLVAESKAVPPTPNVPEVLVFNEFTKFSTLGVPVGAPGRPSIPKSFVPTTAPCLRRLMPGEVLPVPVLVLPAVVLP